MGKPLQGFVRPELGFAEFTQLNEHADLSRPGGGVLRIEFEHLGIKTQSRFKIPIAKSLARTGRIPGLVLGGGVGLVPLVVALVTKFQINKTAHVNGIVSDPCYFSFISKFSQINQRFSAVRDRSRDALHHFPLPRGLSSHCGHGPPPSFGAD